jgi:hypothetical protein
MLPTNERQVLALMSSVLLKSLYFNGLCSWNKKSNNTVITRVPTRWYICLSLKNDKPLVSFYYAFYTILRIPLQDAFSQTANGYFSLNKPYVFRNKICIFFMFMKKMNHMIITRAPAQFIDTVNMLLHNVT